MLQPGTVFAGDYRVVRPLSEGGMGSVFVVEQLSTGAQRALKLMRREIVMDASMRDRFLLEARVGSKIASDHVVQVLAAGIDQASGAPWLVMEFLVGEELEARVKKRGPMPPREVAEVARQMSHALSAAHAVGVVHRDLKPGNLFLATARTAGAAFSLKVLDFGIAKIVEEAQTTGTMGLGTPLWMAPEQTERKGYVGPGTDLWAFGLIAFYMLTGRVFWLAASEANTGIQALLRELLFEPIALPSRRAAELGVGGLVPPGFDAWFLRCVERDPAKREARVGVAVTELVRLLEHAGAGAAGPLHSPAAETGPSWSGTPAAPHAPQHVSPHAASQPAAHASASSPQQAPQGTHAAAPLTYGPGAHSSQPPGAHQGLAHQGAQATSPAMPLTYAPGIAGTSAPVVHALATGPAPSRRGVGLLLGLGALVVVGGGVAAFMLSGSSSKRTSSRKRNDDDDDDDDDGPKKRTPPPTTDDLAADCAELGAFKDRVERVDTPDGGGPADLEAFAKDLAALARDGGGLKLRTPAAAAVMADFLRALRDVERDARSAAIALQRGSDAEAERAIEAYEAALEAAERNGRGLCNWPAPQELEFPPEPEGHGPQGT